MEQKEILEYLKRSLEVTTDFEDGGGFRVKTCDGKALMHRVEALIDVIKQDEHMQVVKEVEKLSSEVPRLNLDDFYTVLENLIREDDAVFTEFVNDIKHSLMMSYKFKHVYHPLNKTFKKWKDIDVHSSRLYANDQAFGNSKLCNKCNKVGSNCVCSYMICKDEVKERR